MSATLTRLVAVALVLLATFAAQPAAAALMGSRIEVTGMSARFPDVEFGSQNGKYLVAWPSNGLIYGRLITRSGALDGTEFQISDTGYGALYPNVTYNATDNEFLVIWEQWDRLGGPWGQRVNASTGQLKGANFQIGTQANGARPVAAWSSGSNTYLVAYWAPVTDTYVQLISASGSPIGATTNLSSDIEFSGYPAVACLQSGNRFLVTWDYSPASGDPAFDNKGYIVGRRVSASTGSALSARSNITSVGGESRSAIASDQTNGRWLIQCNEGAYAGYGYDQFGQLVNSDGSLHGNSLPIAHSAAFEGETILGCDIAFSSGQNRYLSVYQYYLGEDGGIGFTELNATGQPTAPPSMIGYGSYGHMGVAADSAMDRFLVVWESLEGSLFHPRAQLYVIRDPVTNFFAAPQDTQTHLTWTNPSDSRFASTMIRYSTSGYPSSPSTGSLVVSKANSPGTSDGFDHTGLTNEVKHYYSAFAFDSDGIYSLVAMTSATPTPRPTVVNVTSTKANGGYKQGEVINVQAQFSCPVYVTGSPKLELETGGIDRLISYSTGSGSNTLTFVYSVQSGDASPDLDYKTVDSLALNGGTIRDIGGRDASLPLPSPGGTGSISFNKSIVIDALRPTVTGVSSSDFDGACKAGTTVNVEVVFSEPVVVTGTPLLELETGTTDRTLSYSSGSGTDRLGFAYTVQAGDTTSDLDYKSTSSLTSTGATIKDMVANFATLTLPTPGAAGSLAAKKDIRIDTTAPGTTTATPTSGVYNAAKSVALTGTEPGITYYTLDGSEPTTSSPAYSEPISIATDTTLRFFTVDAAGNAEDPQQQAVYAILSTDGSTGNARASGIGASVRLGGKVFYTKQGTFGYIEELDRWSGIRLEGALTAPSGQLVCLTGTRQVTAGGEPCILVDRITPMSSTTLGPLGSNNRDIQSGTMEGLLVKTWGIVKAGTVQDHSYVISDGSSDIGIKVITQGAPGVVEGSFVTVVAACGREGQRVIYRID